jgi:uncharacterized phage-associated protein
MSVPALSAARTLCELRGWKLSNLAIQKILYLAHMYHLGTHGRPLIDENFEAWDYGPVIPSVYRHARGFGSGPVGNVFHWVPEVSPNTAEYNTLSEVAELTRNYSSGQLVNITHWEDGAWASRYLPGFKGVTIPDEAIKQEYHDRVRA